MIQTKNFETILIWAELLHLEVVNQWHTNIWLQKPGELICDRSMMLLNEDASVAKLLGHDML